MHDGSDPFRITTGDTWIHDHMDDYIQWARTNNSLFILTFDEDDDHHSNHIVTIFNGQMVKSGEYIQPVNHYVVLRTIEDMYGLAHACNAEVATPISNSWNSTSTFNLSTLNRYDFVVYPNPSNGEFTIQVESPESGNEESLKICNMVGETIFSKMIDYTTSNKIFLKNMAPGIYLVKISDGRKSCTKKLIIR